MPPLALARRYRPRTFGAMIGQEVTLRALRNALDIQRLHHAYLFTGTRGVGKTTLARIFAKCLNCEVGISSTPCEHCAACRDIDEGRFIDLIEVDAASRTKVEDTRELLDNVQYLPTRGRFKIYLIDEVHMLSGHSFNALLKTLEEPPAHVKFLLATTDPQKLPVTVLSRCLQFHLKRVPFNKIVDYLGFVAKQEDAFFEVGALHELSRAAEGSLRDALSLLDQALAYGNGRVETQTVETLLGLSDIEHVLALLKAVAYGEGKRALNLIQSLAESAPDFSLVLTQLIGILHQIAIAQSVPEALEESLKGREGILKLSEEISKEEIQLYYQIALQGQKDLPYTPTPQMGFEMTILRMVAFQPVRVATKPAEAVLSTSSVTVSPSVSDQVSVTEEMTVSRITVPSNATNQISAIDQVLATESLGASVLPESDWNTLINQLNITGLSKALAEQCVITAWSETFIGLTLDESQKPLWNKRHEERLCEALCHYLGRTIRLKITMGKVEGRVETHTPTVEKKTNQPALDRSVHADPHIQKLMQTFDAKIVE